MAPMTVIATFGNVRVEERERGFAICITNPDTGTTTRVGGLIPRRHKAIEAARSFAEETS